MEQSKLDALKANTEEFEKCKNSLCYYYNNYVRRKNDPILTEEEFAKLQDHWKLIRAGKMLAKPRYKDVEAYPLTEKEVHKTTFRKNYLFPDSDKK